MSGPEPRVEKRQHKLPRTWLMHPCLSNEDVLSEIFLYFADCKDDRKTSTVLAYLARTCKAFSGLALSILWRELDTLLPLFFTAPPDLWEIKVQPWKEPSYVTNGYYLNGKGWQSTGVLNFTRAPQEEDLIRIRYYGAKIYVFDQEHDYGENVVHESVWKALAPFYPMHKLFPNLRCLRLFLDLPHTAQTLPYLWLLIGPKTETIALTLNPYWKGPERNWDIVNFAATVLQLSPHLCNLYLNLPIPNACEPLSDLVRSLRRLSTIYCSPRALTKAGITHLVRSRALYGWEGLELSNFERSGEDIMTQLTMMGLPGYTTPRRPLLFDLNLFETQNGYFPSLTSLGLISHTWENATDVIRRIEKPLEKITVHQKDYMGVSTDLGGFVRQLPRFKTTLREVLLHGGMPGYMVAKAPQVLESSLEPLTSLSNLQSLFISSAALAILKDTVIMKFSAFWPRLRSLHLGGGQFTLTTLATLTRNCPELEKLDVDFVLQSTTAASLDPIVPNTRVTRLPKTEVVAEDTQIQELTNLLLSILPNLMDIGTVRGDDGKKFAMFEQVRRWYRTTEA